ncbi:MAG TPA: MerR family transcriptional regulator [Ktedonobacterales bacterium]|jgi:DNA-binding transcriptional MerR regulator|nr:MerR family transcriptional regulator [Ktedonobacterales bacterium]
MALSSATATSATPDAPKMYTIGDLARELDVSTRTIRYYEERGLLSPQRTINTQQRLYTPGDRVRLKLLLRARGLGFRLEDIRELFEIYDATHDERRQGQRLRQMIVERLEQVEAQLQDMTDLRDELRDALAAVDRQMLPE